MTPSDAYEMAQRSGCAGRLYEFILTAAYARLARPGDLVVDAGAHKGVHTWPLSRMVGPRGRVVAVEPIPEFADHLRREAVSFPFANIEVAECALAAAPGQASFIWVTEAPGYSGLEARALPEHVPAERTEISVETQPLDALLQPQPLAARFIKLDLEGGEFHALLGAEQRLRRDRPYLIFEHGRQASADLYGYDAEAFFALFERLDYDLFDILGAAFGPDQWGAPKAPYYYIATPRGGDSAEFWAKGYPQIFQEASQRFQSSLLFSKELAEQMVRTSAKLAPVSPERSERLLEMAHHHQPNPWLTLQLERLRQRRMMPAPQGRVN